MEDSDAGDVVDVVVFVDDRFNCRTVYVSDLRDASSLIIICCPRCNERMGRGEKSKGRVKQKQARGIKRN